MTSKRKEVMTLLKSFDALKEYKPEFNQPVVPVSTPVFDAILAHRSGSMKCVDYLSSLGGDAIELTAFELAEKAGTTNGAASGFLAKLVKTDVADYGSGYKGRMTYHINLLKVKNGEVSTRNIRGKGRKPGSITNAEDTRHRASGGIRPTRDEPLPLASATEFPTIAAALRHYADDLDNFRTSLSLYSDEELLDELKSRLRS